MGRLKRMLGLERNLPHPRAAHRSETTDEQALQRYRSLLRAAPPETVEEAHVEAFTALTPEQRQQVRAELGAVTAEHERPTSDDPETLARAATGVEMRQPGTLERAFGGLGAGGLSSAGRPAGSLLAGVAGAYAGTSVAAALHGGPTGPASAPTPDGTGGAR